MSHPNRAMLIQVSRIVRIQRTMLLCMLLPMAVLCRAEGAPAGDTGQTLIPTSANARQFLYQDGGQLYRAICQGCHMADGKGAQGAGAYPALAANPRLAAGLYAVNIVQNGKNGMPPVGRFLDDAQTAAVVNYVRSHFGNDYRDVLTAADVKQVAVRPRPGF